MDERLLFPTVLGTQDQTTRTWEAWKGRRSEKGSGKFQEHWCVVFILNSQGSRKTHLCSDTEKSSLRCLQWPSLSCGHNDTAVPAVLVDFLLTDAHVRERCHRENLEQKHRALVGKGFHLPPGAGGPEGEVWRGAWVSWHSVYQQKPLYPSPSKASSKEFSKFMERSAKKAEKNTREQRKAFSSCGPCYRP